VLTFRSDRSKLISRVRGWSPRKGSKNKTKQKKETHKTNKNKNGLSLFQIITRIIPASRLVTTRWPKSPRIVYEIEQIREISRLLVDPETSSMRTCVFSPPSGRGPVIPIFFLSSVFCRSLALDSRVWLGQTNIRHDLPLHQLGSYLEWPWGFSCSLRNYQNNFWPIREFPGSSPGVPPVIGARQRFASFPRRPRFLFARAKPAPGDEAGEFQTQDRT